MAWSLLFSLLLDPRDLPFCRFAIGLLRVPQTGSIVPADFRRCDPSLGSETRLFKSTTRRYTYRSLSGARSNLGSIPPHEKRRTAGLDSSKPFGYEPVLLNAIV